LIGAFDKNPAALREFSRRFGRTIPSLPLPALVRHSSLLIEAASPAVLQELLPLAIRHRRRLMILSSGGLLLYPQLLKKALRRRIPIYLPSGALAGIDGVKAAAVGKLTCATLTTRKPPPALGFMKKLRVPKTLFEGPARKAVKLFPQNINVAATLALAGLGSKKTTIRIVADPRVRENVHELEIRGDFGRLTLRTENRPSLGNPKTSRLAIFSALATLRQMVNSPPLVVGT
jgi:aspartate dehydrogenase